MNPMLLASLGGCALLMMAAAAVLLTQTRREERMAARLREVRLGAQPASARAAAAEPALSLSPMRLVAMLGSAIARSGLLPAKTLTELEHTLTSAGFRGRNGLGLFVGSKLLMLLAGPVLAWFLFGWLGFATLTHELGTFGGGVIGLLSPDWIVRSLRKRHLKAVERGLPDAMDMMVICAEAGLALEPAITRVGREIGAAHPAVSAEFAQTASELRIVADHKVALVAMGQRTGLDGLKRLATTLVQTIQYGTPLTDALRVLSAELRQEMLTRFEARAARLPVLLTVPMIVFILPCVFLIVGGPAIIQVIHIFKG